MTDQPAPPPTWRPFLGDKPCNDPACLCHEPNRLAAVAARAERATSGPRAAQIAAVIATAKTALDGRTVDWVTVPMQLIRDLIDAVHAAGRDGQDEMPEPRPDQPPTAEDRALVAAATGCAIRSREVLPEFVDEPGTLDLEPVTGDLLGLKRRDREAEARGWAKAVEALRDLQRALGRRWDASTRHHLADYLDAVGPAQTGQDGPGGPRVHTGSAEAEAGGSCAVGPPVRMIADECGWCRGHGYTPGQILDEQGLPVDVTTSHTGTTEGTNP